MLEKEVINNDIKDGFQSLSPERLPNGPVLTESGSVEERDQVAELMESASSIVFDDVNVYFDI